MLNQVIIIGRLTKNPELRYTQNNTAVTSFTLAVQRDYANRQGEKEADFLPVVVFGKHAENCANYLRKGRMAAVSGRIQIRSWEDENKKKHYVTEILATKVIFLGEKPETWEEQKVEEFVPIDSEDLPF